MPEFHNLQCYTHLQSETFRDAISRFGAVLRASGVRDPRVDEYLRTADWEGPDEAYVSTGPRVWADFVSAGFQLRGAPHILAYTPGLFPGQDTGWLELSLLFETDALQTGSSFSTWEYKPGLGPAIWHLMKHLGPAFPGVGVFFTDEAQDGQPLDGIVEETDARWEFDLAWIPERNAHLFPPKDAFIQARVPGGAGVARTAAWNDPPWHAAGTAA